MTTKLILFGAVPFKDCEGSIAQRRRKKNAITEPIDELLMLQVASEAAEAIQFVLGPRHRSQSFSSTNRSSVQCPPNTPINKFSFDFENDADNEDSSDEASKRKEASQEKTLKRKRLCSFSGAAPNIRRVPNKKSSPAPKDTLAKTQTKNLPQKMTNDVTDGSIVSRLSFYSEVQKAVGSNKEILPEEQWRNLGGQLRKIADRFAGKSGTSKAVSTEVLPNKVWSAILSFVFWKLIRGWK